MQVFMVISKDDIWREVERKCFTQIFFNQSFEKSTVHFYVFSNSSQLFPFSRICRLVIQTLPSRQLHVQRQGVKYVQS